MREVVTFALLAVWLVLVGHRLDQDAATARMAPVQSVEWMPPVNAEPYPVDGLDHRHHEAPPIPADCVKVEPGPAPAWMPPAMDDRELEIVAQHREALTAILARRSYCRCPGGQCLCRESGEPCQCVGLRKGE